MRASCSLSNRFLEKKICFPFPGGLAGLLMMHVPVIPSMASINAGPCPISERCWACGDRFEWGWPPMVEMNVSLPSTRAMATNEDDRLWTNV